MDLNDLRSFVTLFSFCFFLALAAWAWRPARRAELDEAAQLPFRGEAEFATDGARDE
jgi:cytochrome c oxidase cbb3-type subunit 4